MGPMGIAYLSVCESLKRRFTSSTLVDYVYEGGKETKPWKPHCLVSEVVRIAFSSPATWRVFTR